VALYEKLAKEFGPDQDFARLFMAPGLTHCGLGGTGLNGFESAQSSMLPPPSDDARHDLFVALSAWVEDKKTPTEVVATSYVDNKDASKGIAMQRPLCPYPQKAWYRGKAIRTTPATLSARASSPNRSHDYGSRAISTAPAMNRRSPSPGQSNFLDGSSRLFN
jgi:hypothetical protein